jgi:hypothetical protein
MILLPNNSIIISYHPYVYKDGGFCFVVDVKGNFSNQEIELTEEQMLSFKPIPLNKNHPISWDYYYKIYCEQELESFKI